MIGLALLKHLERVNESMYYFEISKLQIPMINTFVSILLSVINGSQWCSANWIINYCHLYQNVAISGL